MKLKFAVAAAVVAVAAPAVAHHSFAMFDTTKEVELKNVTVKEWQWTSPHTWLFVVTPDGKKWSLEGGNPGLMRRQGFTKGSFAPNMKVTVYVAPLRSGQPGGAINAALLPGGKTLGERNKMIR